MQLITEYFLHNLLEIIAALTSVIGVWLMTKTSIWNWIIMIIACILYAMVFYNNKLYSDALLQLFFLVFQGYGFFYWKNKKEKNIEYLSIKKRINYLVIAVILIILWKFFIVTLKPDSAYPWLDSIGFILSIIATFLQTYKKIDNWYIWIFVNILYIYLYWNSELYISIVLYFILIILAIVGLINWQKKRLQNLQPFK